MEPSNGLFQESTIFINKRYINTYSNGESTKSNDFIYKWIKRSEKECTTKGGKINRPSAQWSIVHVYHDTDGRLTVQKCVFQKKAFPISWHRTELCFALLCFTLECLVSCWLRPIWRSLHVNNFKRQILNYTISLRISSTKR